jgi:alanyl-tRNA synthetase
MEGGELRSLCDRCRDRGMDKAVVVLAGTSAEKRTVSFACYCTDGAIAAGANAGAIVREVAALCGGKGGGRPDMAMAGGKELNKVADAMAKVPEILKNLVKG